MNPDFEAIAAEIPGWCSVGKMQMLYEAVLDLNAKRVIEIGVYGARSLLPLAFGVAVTQGEAWGIDPWSVEHAMQSSALMPGHYDSINREAGATNWNALYHGAHSALVRYGVADVAFLLRMPSHEAVGMFDDGQVDLLHIDGNHGDAAVMQDVHLWLPKMRRGALMWFDDANWPSVAPAVRHAEQFGSREAFEPEHNVVVRIA